MSNGLRIMLYDSSDTYKNVLQESTPEELNFVDDFLSESDLDISLTEIWRYGGWLYRAIPGRWHMDHTAGFSDWGDALKWLCEVGGDQPIDEIQYWGHGSPGKVWMKNQVLHSRSFSEFSNWGHLLKRLSYRFHKDSMVWFRTCSTFCGDPGQKFAKTWAKELNCNVAAHTYIIHALQGGLHSIRPGQEPCWDRDEGIKTGIPERPGSIKWTDFKTPNSIFALRNEVPHGW